MERINVTKTFFPPLNEYETYLAKIWESGQITNQGPLLNEFQKEISNKLAVDNFHFVSNGTIALQLALKGLNISGGEIITTPFTYVATTSAILWERCTPVFVDIERDTFCIDADKIEAAITPNTKAIMAVHVFGNPCDIEKIQIIAKRHDLKVIYDAAHAFGVNYNGRSLLSYGDISTCSFHATKVFHTIEGGGIFTSDSETSDKIDLLKRFGHNGDEHIALGINGKASELQAAMGLLNLKYIDDIIEQRGEAARLYDRLLGDNFQIPVHKEGVRPNYGYYPLIFDSEKNMLDSLDRLNQDNIFPRRYFYPSLNKLPYIPERGSCPISESIASRVLCLPLYAGLTEHSIDRVCRALLR